METICYTTSIVGLFFTAIYVYFFNLEVGMELKKGLFSVMLLAILPLNIKGNWKDENNNPHIGVIEMILLNFKVFFYAMYLVIEVMILCGRRKHDCVPIDEDDYIKGVIMVYLDIYLFPLYLVHCLCARDIDLSDEDELEIIAYVKELDEKALKQEQEQQGQEQEH